MNNKTLACTITGVALTLISLVSNAVPVDTGDPLGPNSFGWIPNSTNEKNYNKLVPGREGQSAPYVLFNSNAAGSVTLDFYNPGPGQATFEYRIDGIPTGTYPHFVVKDCAAPTCTLQDTIHQNIDVITMTNELNQTYAATNYVDIRLALGGERDWDFDWVRFDVAPVPVPAAVWLFGSGLLGLVGIARRKKAA